MREFLIAIAVIAVIAAGYFLFLEDKIFPPEVEPTLEPPPQPKFPDGNLGGQAPPLLLPPAEPILPPPAVTPPGAKPPVKPTPPPPPVLPQKDKPFRVGVNYHSIGADFDKTSFIREYHKSAVRAKVLSQLQGMADAGADIIKTSLWFVDLETDPATWRLHFPATSQEVKNIVQYAKDVSQIRSKGGRFLKLIFAFNYLGCADYSEGDFRKVVGYPGCDTTWDYFTKSVKKIIDDIVPEVGKIRRPDSVKIVDRIYLISEAFIYDPDLYGGVGKKNEDQFFKDVYPYFISKARAAGLTPSIYLIGGLNEEKEILDTAYRDEKYEELNGRWSQIYNFRTINFMRENGLPLPERLDFSFYPGVKNESYGAIVNRLFEDIKAVFPEFKKVGVVETLYPKDAGERTALAEAYKEQFLKRGMPDEVIFWTTPDGGGDGAHVAYPFDIKTFLLTDI